MESLSSLTGNKIALLIDFDNVILGVDDPGFDVEIVVNALRSRGNVVMGRAYGDWYRHHRHRRKLMEQGIELVETPVFGPLIKNSADIRIVLDGFEIAMSQSHINTFCLVSGDSDFLPLIKKLQYLGKHVIVIAGIKFTSDLIRRNCNEYISYENLFAESVGATEDVSVIEGAYALLERAINTLNERIMDVRSSSVKQMMVQLNPAFSERTFGCSQFKQFLERAARDGRVNLEPRDGSAGESSVYWREDAPRAEPKPAPLSGSASNGASRDGDRPGERRDLSTARRSGRKFSGRSGRLQSEAQETAPAPATLKPPKPPVEEPAAPVAPAPTESADSLAEDEFVAVAPPNGGFVNALAKRNDLRRGRLRFSAKTGTSAAPPAAAAPTPETVAAPVEQEQLFAIDESTLPAVDESAEQTAEATQEIAEAAETDAAPKKRATRRGGRTRKKKDATEEAVAAESAVQPTEPQTAPAEAAPAEAAPVESAALPAARPSRALRGRAAAAKAAEPAPVAETEVTAASAPAESAEAAPSEAAEPEAAPKKATRTRRGGTKRTAARKKKDGESEAPAEGE